LLLYIHSSLLLYTFGHFALTVLTLHLEVQINGKPVTW